MLSVLSEDFELDEKQNGTKNIYKLFFFALLVEAGDYERLRVKGDEQLMK